MYLAKLDPLYVRTVMCRLLYNMVEFYVHDGIETMFQSSMRIYHIFEYLLSPPEKQIQQDNPIEQAIRYIHSNIGQDISLKQLADIARLSPYYFSHRFKEQTGFAPLEYVINTRLDRAKVLLARTSKSVSCRVQDKKQSFLRSPVMLIKIPFIQYLYGIKSMRQTIKEIEVNVAYR